MTQQSSFDTIAGLAFTLALLALGIASIVAATVFANRWFRRRGWSDLRVAWFTVGAAFLAFIGLWLVFDVYWIGRVIVRSLRPSTRR